MLYYGGSAAGGLKAGEFITELTSREDLQQFVTSQDERVRLSATAEVFYRRTISHASNVSKRASKQETALISTGLQVLTVVDVSLSNAIGCVRLFPAVLALAKSFKGFASFARLLGDSNAETQQMMSELDIKAVCACAAASHALPAYLELHQMASTQQTSGYTCITSSSIRAPQGTLVLPDWSSWPNAAAMHSAPPARHCTIVLHQSQQHSFDRNRMVQVPTMLFYRGGKLVGRHVGSSRGDLMGQILQQQAAHGIRPPPPPSVQGRSRKSVAPV